MQTSERQASAGTLAPRARYITCRQSPPDSAFARLCARILPACGLKPLWDGRRNEVFAAAANDANLTAWLQQAEAGSK